MSTNKFLLRSNGQPINTTWWNVFRTALSQDLAARNTSGIVTDQAGSLGTDTLRWLYMYTELVNLMVGARTAGLQAPSGLAADYNLALPSAQAAATKIVSVDNSGQMEFAIAPDNVGIEFHTLNTGLRLKDNGLTGTKLVSVGQQVSSASGSFTTTSGSFVDVTNLSVTITTSGRPVYLSLLSGNATTTSVITQSGAQNATVILLRGSTQIANWNTFVPTHAPGEMYTLDFPAAGTYTYKVQGQIDGGGASTLQITNMRLLAYEML